MPVPCTPYPGARVCSINARPPQRGREQEAYLAALKIEHLPDPVHAVELAVGEPECGIVGRDDRIGAYTANAAMAAAMATHGLRCDARIAFL